MSHELETFRNGDAAFYSLREPAWHRLGTISETPLSVADSLKAARLNDWDIVKQPVVTLGHDGTAIEVPGKYATVRRNPDPELAGQSDVLGLVGEDYTVVQNEEGADFLTQLVDDGEATIETCGSLREGRRVFITLKLPVGVQIADGDDLDLYCAVAFGHDGLFAFHAFPTPVRVVCANTLGIAMEGAKDTTYRMIHTDGIGLRLQKAREAIRLTFAEGELIGAAAREMLSTEMTNTAFDKLIAANFVTLDKDPTDAQKARAEVKRNDLRTLFRDAPTQEVGRNTTWGAFNAISEYVEWVAPKDSSAERSVESVLYGKGSVTRQRAWDLLAPKQYASV